MGGEQSERARAIAIADYRSSYETVTPLFVVVEFELLMKAADSMLNVQSLGVFRGSQMRVAMALYF